LEQMIPKSIVPVESNDSSLQNSFFTNIPVNNHFQWRVVRNSATILPGPTLNLGNRKAVIFVEGNLSINKNITTGTNGNLIFIVDGRISIGPNVTRLDGVYFADDNFQVTSAAPPTE